MKKIYANLGGRPGLDCGGFCRFCFFKKVDFNQLNALEIGCVNCPPDTVGCSYCRDTITGVKNKFKPLNQVLMELQNQLIKNAFDALNENIKIVVHADADVFSYPQLTLLVSIIKQTNLPLHLGYTSGKAIENIKFAHELIKLGLDELTFSAFSTDPEVRRQWMMDKNPTVSLKSLKLFCQNLDVHASVVVVPGVNDGQNFLKTCQDLEEWGIKSLVLRRFGNHHDQGLIFNHQKPVSEGIKPQKISEFQELVEVATSEFSFKITSFPFYDPNLDFPFAILKPKNRIYLQKLPRINKPATIITGKLAWPYLDKFIKYTDSSHLVNVMGVDKEIADLITPEDVESLDLSDVKQQVIIPRGALVHDNQVQELLSRDGMLRKIKRGPYNLTHPYHENLSFNYLQLIDYELASFKELIEIINQK